MNLKYSFTLIAISLLAACSRPPAPTNSQSDSPAASEPIACTPALGEPVTIATAKLIIEYNSTDDDIGVHGAFDDHGWSELCVFDPNGILVLAVEPQAQLKDLSMAGIFFESREPPSEEFSFADLKAKFPEGEYKVLGVTFEGQRLTGSATFTHDVPVSPTITSPLLADEEHVEEAVVPASDLVVVWEDVTETLDGGPVTITGYEVIITKVDHEDPNGFSRPTFDVHLPADRNSLSVPAEFLEPGTVYELEVLALEVSGNQTITVGFFQTEAQSGSASADQPYTFNLTPADFVALIDNPYFPAIPGSTYVYEGQTQEGLERIEIKVLNETREVMGVTTTVIRDSVFLDGTLVEDTVDWYAQDKEGNVWYFGEVVDNYEDGRLKDHAGSWEAGVDGALPGIYMYADPAAHVGETYYQEYYAGEAEDQATLLSAGESVTIGYGSFENVVKTNDFTLLDPDSQEHKFYAAGIGVIQTINLNTGETFELVEFTPAGTTGAQPGCGTESGSGCAPDSARVDIVIPTFSNPTRITNPLFPISNLRSAILLGSIDGHLFRAETTLLPETRIIEWNGQQIETLVSQYTAYLDGRIHEVALDWYAQADDGSVWYFGEDVANYQDGVILDTHGTWLAGKDGLAALIMPAVPRVGDVYRPENIPGLVFEEVTVAAINQTLTGPHGPVEGAMITTQLYQGGGLDDKYFAPGYGEFYTGSRGNHESLALAVPTDALPGLMPVECETLYTSALAIFDAAEAGDWAAVSAAREKLTDAWAAYRAGGVPPLLEIQMNRALEALGGDALVPAANAQDATGTRKAALAVALAGLDFQLQYRPPAEIDLARFDLWTLHLLVDAAGGEPGDVAGDVTTLEWIWQRIAHTLDAATAEEITARLEDLRAAADDEDLSAANSAAVQLREVLAGASGL